MNYILFLILLAVCTMLPACGSVLLDSFAWFWCATITIELAISTLKTHCLQYSHSSIRWKVIDCLFQVLFLFFFLLYRLAPWYFWDNNSLRPMAGRVTLCTGILYFTYRLPLVYMAISQTLGPQIVWMKYTLSHDFAGFFRLALVVVFVGAVVINTIVYPYWPFNKRLIERGLLRAFIAFFFTEKADMDEAGKGTCSSINLGRPTSREFCFRQMKHPSEAVPIDEWSNPPFNTSYTCARASPMGWIFASQYFIIIRLFLWTILLAMFNDSYKHISAYSNLVWTFKRYENVMTLKNASPFPPPLNLFYYLFELMRTFCTGGTRMLRSFHLAFSRKRSYLSRNAFKQFHDYPKQSISKQEEVYWRALSGEQHYAFSMTSPTESISSTNTIETSVLISRQRQLKQMHEAIHQLQNHINSIGSRLKKGSNENTEISESSIPSAQNQLCKYYDPVKLSRKVNWNGIDYVHFSDGETVLIDRRSWVFDETGNRIN